MTNPIILPNEIEFTAEVLDLKDKIRTANLEMVTALGERQRLKECRAMMDVLMKQCSPDSEFASNAEIFYNEKTRQRDTEITALEAKISSLESDLDNLIGTLTESNKINFRFMTPEGFKETELFKVASLEIPKSVMGWFLQKEADVFILERSSDSAPIAIMFLKKITDTVTEILGTFTVLSDVKDVSEMFVKELISLGRIPEIRIHHGASVSEDIVKNIESYGCQPEAVIMGFSHLLNQSSETSED